MNRLTHKKLNRQRRANRVRSSISTAPERPRLAVRISNLHVIAQIVDDSRGATLVYSTTVGRKIDGNLTDKAAWTGTDIAQKAKKAKIAKVAFDRSSRKYHGRVKALADAARKEGLEF